MVAALLAGGGAQFIFADTIRLKDATITGKILAEKSDALVVDLGFTVLVVPRNFITAVTKSAAAAANSADPVTSMPPPLVVMILLPLNEKTPAAPNEPAARPR